MAGHIETRKTQAGLQSLSIKGNEGTAGPRKKIHPPVRDTAGKSARKGHSAGNTGISPDFIDRIPSGLLELSPDGVILAANTPGAELLGRPALELAGSNLKSVVLPGHSEILDGFLQKLAGSGAPLKCEVMAGTPPRWVEIFAELTPGEKSCLAEIRDITEFIKSRAERKFLNSVLEARLHLALFGNTNSLDGVLIETLDILERLTGSLIGFYHFLMEDQKTLSLKAWSTRTSSTYCSASGKGTHYDVDQGGVWVDCVREKRTVIHNDYASLPGRKGLPPGHAPLVRELVVPVFRGDKMVAILGVGNKPSDYTEEDARLVEMFADMSWDIAERKIMFQKLKTSEANFRAIAEYTCDWELWVGTDGVLCWTNLATNTLTGYTAEEITAMEDFPAKVVAPPDREYFMKHFNAALTGESADNVEFRIKTKEGTLKWGSLSYRTIFDDRGGKLGFRASIRDITALKRTYDELDRLNEKLITMITSRHK